MSIEEDLAREAILLLLSSVLPLRLLSICKQDLPDLISVCSYVIIEYNCANILNN